MDFFNVLDIFSKHFDITNEDTVDRCTAMLNKNAFNLKHVLKVTKHE